MRMPDYVGGFQYMPGKSQEFSKSCFYHHSWSCIALSQQIADCNVFLLNVQLSSVSVHLGLIRCQYGSFPRPYSGLSHVEVNPEGLIVLEYQWL